MKISDEAVEAAARGLALQAWGDWEYVPDELRRLFLRDARTALEAAAPHMQQEPAAAAEPAGNAGDMWKHLLAEPVKSAAPGTEDFRGWLRERPHRSQA